jgi:cytosine/adenosine deaminase-related metal-dependent hydrolase
MQKAGMQISIGQDGGAAAEPSSMLMEVHQSLYMQRAAFGVDAAEPAQCIRWASHGGAKVLGLDQTGVIAPGYEADLAIYDVDDLAGAAFHAPEFIPVLRGSAPLQWLLCGGRVVVEDGQIPGLDMEALKERTRRAVGKLKTWQADIRSGAH